MKLGIALNDADGNAVLQQSKSGDEARRTCTNLINYVSCEIVTVVLYIQ